MNAAARRAILLFTRAPEAEARAKGLPVEAGSRLFEAFLGGWRERAAQTGADLLVVAPSESVRTLRRLFPDACVAAQQGPSFGARVEAAFSFAFARGAGAVLMAGCDSPPLEAPEVEAAFAHLDSSAGAMALAPAEDGGVNAIGLNAAADRRIAHIRWLGADVDRQLRAFARRDGLALWLSSSSPDLDRVRDLAGLYRLSRFAARWRVFRALLRRLLAGVGEFLSGDRRAPAGVALDSPITRGPPRALSLSL